MPTPHEGDRVQLIRCNDPHTRLEPGARGTVLLVDSMGTVHVKWDSGSSLGLVAEDGDAWRVLQEDDLRCAICGHVHDRAVRCNDAWRSRKE